VVVITTTAKKGGTQGQPASDASSSGAEVA